MWSASGSWWREVCRAHGIFIRETTVTCFWVKLPVRQFNLEWNRGLSPSLFWDGDFYFARQAKFWFQQTVWKIYFHIQSAEIRTRNATEEIRRIFEVAYPTNQKQIIDLIDKTNRFLRNLGKSSNPDNLGVDLYPKKEKCPVFDVKKILDKLI